MTNTTTPVESMGAPSGAASFYRWEVAGKPVAILFGLDLMDRLERDVLESFKAVTKRGSEIGGVLGGRIIPGNQPTVIIEQFEPVECDYSRGPLYLLSDADKVRMKQALDKVSGASGVSVTGFFRSNTRRELVLDEEDQAVAKEFFADPNHVFLLVRPFAMKPSAGGFFFWENGQLAEHSYMEFPFKRAELLKSFAQFIVAAPEAPVVKEPLVMPRREERPAAPPVAFKREEPKPAAAPPPPPPPPPAAVRREEPAPAPPPVFKREETRPSSVVPPRREEAPPVSFRREERPAPPVMQKREPPVIQRREERQPIIPKREERPSGPTLVSRREEPPAPAAPPPPPVIAKKEEKPPAPPPVTPRRDERPPVVVRREERPTVTPVVAKREEPAPAPAPAKPEEKPVVAAKPPETVVVVAPPKKEEPPKVEPVRVEPPKAAEPPKVEPPKPAPPPRVQPAAAAAPAAPVERIAPQVEEAPQPGFVSRFKWVIVVLLLLVVGGGGYYFYLKSKGPGGGSATVADNSLGLKVETSAGQLVLSWNRVAPLVAAATRGTLTINDGDHKEDVDLDLTTLRSGSVVYSAISNDVSFRLEVFDQKTGKSQAETVRRLSGRPSPAVVASNAPQTQQPQQQQQQQPQATKPAPAANVPPVTAQTQPAQQAPAQQPAAAPQVVSTTAVTAQPVNPNSLAARLRATEPTELAAAPALDSQPNTFASSAPNVPGATVAAPPPVASAPAGRPAQSAAPQTRQTTPGQPAPGVRVGGQAQEARVIKRFPATYPTIAKTSHITGIVRVHATIGKNGRVKKANAVSGPQILRSAAVDSVLKWIYSPAILDGEPVEAETQVDVNFQM